MRCHLQTRVCRLSANVEDRSASNAIIRELFHSYAEHESYMSEIELRRIFDKMANGPADQGTDGDEVMQKGGETISMFSKEASTRQFWKRSEKFSTSTKGMMRSSERKMELPRS